MEKKLEEVKDIMYQEGTVLMVKQCTHETIIYAIRISRYTNTISIVSKYSIRKIDGKNVPKLKWSKLSGVNIDTYIRNEICDLFNRGYKARRQYFDLSEIE